MHYLKFIHHSVVNKQSTLWCATFSATILAIASSIAVSRKPYTQQAYPRENSQEEWMLAPQLCSHALATVDVQVFCPRSRSIPLSCVTKEPSGLSPPLWVEFANCVSLVQKLIV